jgi:hypothetical protein
MSDGEKVCRRPRLYPQQENGHKAAGVHSPILIRFRSPVDERWRSVSTHAWAGPVEAVD